MEKILITGGSGLVGKSLTDKLLEKGYKVNWLSRSKKKYKDVGVYIWKPEEDFIDEKVFNDVQYIVHLAGASIADKAWSDNYKEKIRQSRIDTAQLLYDYTKKLGLKLNAFISASAIGYYGTFTSQKTLTEESPSGNDFLANVCKDWELKADQFTNLNIRSVKIRTGIIASENGGAIPKMILPIKWWVGSPLGTGKQYISWIHISDLTNIYIRAIEDSSMEGAYNATAPEKINNEKVTEILATKLNKPLWLPNIPQFVIKTALGERAILLLEGSYIKPEKLMKKRFDFEFSRFKDAVQHF